VNKNLSIFLLAGFVSYYLFLVLLGLLIGQQPKYSDGDMAFQIALFVGPFLAMAFTAILFLTAFARRALFPVASISVVMTGALAAAILALCSLVAIDVLVAEMIDRQIAGAIGDWMVPVISVILTAASAYVGVRVATSDA